jgi:hypothetical protein
MKCNFLSGTYMLACKADRHAYVPSSFEIEEYCKTGRHRICPLYFSTAEKKGDFMKRERYPSVRPLAGQENNGKSRVAS